MKTNTLRFSADGTSVQIIFTDGDETPYFASKIEIFQAIAEYIRQKKLAEKDFEPMKRELIQRKELVWSNEQDPTKKTLVGVNFKNTDSIPPEMMNHMLEAMANPPNHEDWPEKATFKLDGSGVFGTIYSKRPKTDWGPYAGTGKAFSKTEAYLMLEHFKVHLTDEEYATVKKEIGESSIPFGSMSPTAES